MSSLNVIVTREDLEKQIQDIEAYIDQYNYEWHRKTRPIHGPKGRWALLEGSAELVKAKKELLEELKKNHAHCVLYRFDGNYNLIRRILL
jgi:hypothetical protein